MKKIALISHGCAKNLVDSELILGFLKQAGYGITLNEDETDLVIINTCSFICDAEKESVRSILEMIDAGKKVIVSGCLSQKHAEDLQKAIPEIRAIIGTTDITKIIDVVKNKVAQLKKDLSNLPQISNEELLSLFIPIDNSFL